MARLIAIDLGTHAVKVAVYQGGAQGHELEGEFRALIPQDGTERPRLEDRLAALDQLLRQHPEWTDGSHLSAAAYSSADAALHPLALPFDDDEQVAQTLPFAIEAEVPFDLDEMVLGWRRGTPSTAEGTTTEIHAILAREAAVRALVEGLEARGLDPRQVVVDAEALAAFAPDPDEVVAVLDVGHDHAALVVARGGVALRWRSLSVAGRAFTRAIQASLDCSWGQAQALLRGGVAEDDDVVASDGPRVFSEDGEEDTAPVSAEAIAGPVGDDDTDPSFAHLPEKARTAVDGAVGLLLAEVRTTLVRCEDTLGVGIDRLVLTGGASRVPDLSRWLEEDLGVPVSVLKDADGMPVRPTHAVTRGVLAHMGGEAKGAADLRVGDLAYQGGMDVARMVLSYGGAGAAVFLAAVVVMFLVQYQQLASEQGKVDVRIRDTVAQVVDDLPAEADGSQALAELRDRIIDAQDRADFLGDSSVVPHIVDTIYQITNHFPPHPQVKVNVDSLDISPKAIRIEGLTEGFAQVDSIGQSLQESGLYAEVVATPGTKDRNNRIPFDIDIAVVADTGGLDDEDF